MRASAGITPAFDFEAGGRRGARDSATTELAVRAVTMVRGRATIAVCHSILTAVWHMLSTGELCTDPGDDFYARRDPERTRKRLVTQLERLGCTVTLQEEAAAT